MKKEKKVAIKIFSSRNEKKKHTHTQKSNNWQCNFKKLTKLLLGVVVLRNLITTIDWDVKIYCWIKPMDSIQKNVLLWE